MARAALRTSGAVLACLDLGLNVGKKLNENKSMDAPQLKKAGSAKELGQGQGAVARAFTVSKCVAPPAGWLRA